MELQGYKGWAGAYLLSEGRARRPDQLKESKPGGRVEKNEAPVGLQIS